MLQMANLYILTLLQSSRRLSPRLSLLSFIGILLWIGIDLTSARQCSDVTNRAGASGDGNSTPNPIVWRNQPQIHVVNWVNENLCNNVQECYGTDDENQTSAHFPQLCPLYVQHGDPIYFVSGPSEKDFLNPIAVSQNDFSNCSLITYPYYWKVTTFPKRHSLKVPNKFLFPGDHHFVQIPFLGSPGCETGFRLRVTVRTQDCTVPSYPNNPCFGNGYCVFIDKNSPGQSVNESCEIDDDTNNPLLQGLQAFKCKCRVPFKGRYCEDYDACWNHQCQNGGVCHDLRKGINNREYTCSCPLNYIGKHCEFVKSCFEGLCQNGGQCFYDTSRPAHFQCVCQPAFSGNRCEISTGPGPGQQQLTVLTDNLIREQEQRDRALQDQDKMVKTIDQMGGENLTRLSYPRIIIPAFLIGGGRPGATPPPSCAITPGRDPKELDCGVCGCPNGGICIREKAPGPNSCFCPPGVAGPSCKSLAGVCTYAQPCINGGTCLERMTTMEGGASGSGQGDQDDSETLMFPAPGENPAPPPTISWSLLTATPPSPLGENAQNVQSNQGSNVNPNQNQPSEPYVCLCPTGFYGFTCQNTKEELCTTSDGRASGITIIPGTGTGVQDLESATTTTVSSQGSRYNNFNDERTLGTIDNTAYHPPLNPTWQGEDVQQDMLDVDYTSSPYNSARPPIIIVTPLPVTEANTPVPVIDRLEALKLECLNGASPYYVSEIQYGCVCAPAFIGQYCETFMPPPTPPSLPESSSWSPSTFQATAYPPLITRSSTTPAGTTPFPTYPPWIISARPVYPAPFYTNYNGTALPAGSVMYHSNVGYGGGYNNLAVSSYPQYPDATTVIANAICMNGGTPVGTECLCTSQYAGPRCENIATVMIIPDTRGPSTGLTGPGGIVLIPGQPGGIGTSTVSPLVEGTPTATGLGQTGEVCVENQQCQNKGVCVREEGRESKCLCPIGFAGKTCEKNINLDNPLFTGDSFIRTTEPTNWDTSGRLTFDVDMIPQTGSGTVFKVVNGGMNPPNTNVTFQLYLKDGQLHYDIVNVPSGTVIAQVISSNPDVVGNMNKISIENHFTPGTNRLGTIVFIVDNDKSKTRDVATVSNATLSPSNIDIKLAPQSDVYIGAPSGQAVLKGPDVGVEAGTTAGSVPAEKMDKGSEGNFKGSITSFKINGKPIPIGKPGQEGYGLMNATPGSCNNLCRNGGVCKIEGWKASCVCPEGFQGFFCESRSCNHCKNGGMCIDLRGNDNFACLCQFGWTGVQCEQKMDIEVKDTYKFNGIKFGYPSFVNFYPVNTLTDPAGFDIKFKFMIDDPNSPAWRNSMLMFAGQNTAQTSQPSYLVVGLQAGHIVYRFDAGGTAGEMSSSNENGPPPNEGMRELITSQPLDQSIPAHEVRFGRKNGDSWLYVDGQEGVFDKIGNMANGTLDIWNGLYIGGYKTFLMLLLPRGASVFRNGFKGCIYDINVKPPGESQTYQPILQSGAKLANSLNVLPCFKDALCKSGDSCKNGGQCVELGANFHCRCSSPQFTGPTCENVDSTYTTTTISNAIQTNIGGVILPGGLPVTSGTEDENTGLGTSAAGRRSQCELIIDNSLSEAFSVNIKFAGNPDTDQIIIVLNIMAENKSLYKLTFILDFKPLLNIKPGESLAIKDDVFVLPLNNSMTIRNFTLSKIKSKLTINVNDVVHDLKVNITNHEIIHSLSLGLGNLQKNATGLIIEKTNQNFCYKTAELIIQNSIINIEDYFNCNMIEKCKE